MNIPRGINELMCWSVSSEINKQDSGVYEKFQLCYWTKIYFSNFGWHQFVENELINNTNCQIEARASKETSYIYIIAIIIALVYGFRIVSKAVNVHIGTFERIGGVQFPCARAYNKRNVRSYYYKTLLQHYTLL